MEDEEREEGRGGKETERKSGREGKEGEARRGEGSEAKKLRDYLFRRGLPALRVCQVKYLHGKGADIEKAGGSMEHMILMQLSIDLPS